MLHEKATMELSLGEPLHGPPPGPPLNEYTDVTEDNMVVDPRSDEEDIACDGNGAPAVEDEVIINEENWQEQFEQWMGSWEDYMHGEDGYGTDDSDAEEEIPGDGNDGTNDDGDGTSGGKDGRDVHFYQDHLLDPLFPGCPSRTIDTIFFMLHHKRETRMERSALINNCTSCQPTCFLKGTTCHPRCTCVNVCWVWSNGMTNNAMCAMRMIVLGTSSPKFTKRIGSNMRKISVNAAADLGSNE